MDTVLQFSGGKDSLACLYLLKPRWNGITVAWVNTGAAFPETLVLMEDIRAQVPHFIEIKSTQNIRTEGHPVDVVPLRSTRWGHDFEGGEGVRFQPRYACCAHALWAPMQRAMQELRPTTLIRGQKHCDAKKTPIRSGQIIEGVRYEFPLEEWSDADVTAYLKEIGIALPRNYARMSTGLDCWNCTAYLDQNAGRLDYMAEYHPGEHAHVMSILTEYSHALERELKPLREIL